MQMFRSQARCLAKLRSALTLLTRYRLQLALGMYLWFGAYALAADWTIQDLGGQSGINSVGYAINARGQVTGTLQPQNGLHAFFHDGTSNLRFIGTLPGSTDSEGFGINVWGHIVGASGRESDGLWHAMFYNPPRGMFDLDPSGAYSNGYSYASSININAFVVGGGTFEIPPPDPIPPDSCPDYYSGNGGPRALLWDGVIQDLGSLPGYFLWSYAQDINDHGLIVGWSGATPPGPYSHTEPNPNGPDYPPIVVCDSPPFFFHAAYYAGGWRDLGTLGGTNSTANAVNNHAQIVGSSQVAGDVTNHAFLFDRGNLYDIHPPGWGGSAAIDINNNGLIVGTMDNGGTPNGFFYDGSIRNISAFPEVIAAGWNITGAFAINDSGQITGYGVNSNGRAHAYRMHPQSTSRYIKTANVNTLYNLGCSQTNQRGMAVLALGDPRDNSVGGQRDQNTVYGITLFQGGSSFTRISLVELAVQAFLRGYYNCNGNGVMKIAVGTNNHGNYVTREHGQAWGSMIGRLNDFVINSGYGNRLSVVGAIDIEQGASGNSGGWSTPGQARAWVDGYASASRGVGYVNFGSADGCPPAGNCNNGWTQDDIWYVSWGNPASIGPVPEIYFNVPPRRSTNAIQWIRLATLRGGVPRSFAGAMTTWQACRDVPTDPFCFTPTNTPPQGWQQLMDTLYSASPNMAPTVQPLLYSTDITWQN